MIGDSAIGLPQKNGRFLAIAVGVGCRGSGPYRGSHHRGSHPFWTESSTRDCSGITGTAGFHGGAGTYLQGVLHFFIACSAAAFTMRQTAGWIS